jgi:hypothetical protein
MMKVQTIAHVKDGRDVITDEGVVLFMSEDNDGRPDSTLIKGVEGYPWRFKVLSFYQYLKGHGYPENNHG